MKVWVEYLSALCGTVCLNCGCSDLTQFKNLKFISRQSSYNSYFFLGLFLVSVDCPMIQQWYEFTCSYLWNGMLISQTRRLKHHRNGGERS